MTRPEPAPRSRYRQFEPVPMRWGDADIYGHMNNAVHYYLFDTAVQAFLVREGLLDLGRSGTVFLVVSSGCDYFGEIVFGDRIEAGLRIDRLGTSSIRYDISLFRDDDSRSVATGHFTHVSVARDTRRPAPLTAAARDRLVRLA